MHCLEDSGNMGHLQGQVVLVYPDCFDGWFLGWAIFPMKGDFGAVVYSPCSTGKVPIVLKSFTASLASSLLYSTWGNVAVAAVQLGSTSLAFFFTNGSICYCKKIKVHVSFTEKNWSRGNLPWREQLHSCQTKDGGSFFYLVCLLKIQKQ